MVPQHIYGAMTRIVVIIRARRTTVSPIPSSSAADPPPISRNLEARLDPPTNKRSREIEPVSRGTTGDDTGEPRRKISRKMRTITIPNIFIDSSTVITETEEHPFPDLLFDAFDPKSYNWQVTMKQYLLKRKEFATMSSRLDYEEATLGQID